MKKSDKFSLSYLTQKISKTNKCSSYCFEKSKQYLNSVKFKKHLNTKLMPRHKGEKTNSPKKTKTKQTVPPL